MEKTKPIFYYCSFQEKYYQVLPDGMHKDATKSDYENYLKIIRNIK